MLTKEQIESMHTLLVRERPMGTSVAAVDELCRLALLGLERDERQAVTSEQAAKDIKILEQIHAKNGDKPSVRCSCGKLTWHVNALLLCPDCWESSRRLSLPCGKYL